MRKKHLQMHRQGLDIEIYSKKNEYYMYLDFIYVAQVFVVLTGQNENSGDSSKLKNG